MPASSVNLYHMQDSKNNFNAVRPVPLCADSNYFASPCQNIHISTNCYYGYDQNNCRKHVQEYEDCEMKEVTNASHNMQIVDESASSACTARKRTAETRTDDYTYPQNKRLRKEVQTKKSYEPETNERMRLKSRKEELMESLYWNIHGGALYSCYDSRD